MLNFRIMGLAGEPFAHLYGMDEAALAARGVQRYAVDSKPGFPDRVELRDLEVGESALLLNYEHQSAATPYRASHAIFVREGAMQAFDRVNEVPDSLRVRLLSLRAFDPAGMMLHADVSEGAGIEGVIETMLADPAVAYVHVHTAKRGCFMARVERA